MQFGRFLSVREMEGINKRLPVATCKSFSMCNLVRYIILGLLKSLNIAKKGGKV